MYNFDFLGGAKDNALKLTVEQLHEVEMMLEDIYPDGMSETELNDLFWFDFEQICDWLGIEEEEEEE